jgi:large subunit ribosomal protein L6
MSRIGKQPVLLSDKVKATLEGELLKVSGPNGNLEQAIPSGVKVTVSETDITISKTSESIESQARQGLIRSLVYNMVAGVTDGFERSLNIVGVGYRVEKKGDFLLFNLGFSHPIWFEIPEYVDVSVNKSNEITLKSSSKQLLGQTAATIRSFRPPEPYKGKGIRYSDEIIRTKVGKTAVG